MQTPEKKYKLKTRKKLPDVAVDIKVQIASSSGEIKYFRRLTLLWVLFYI